MPNQELRFMADKKMHYAIEGIMAKEKKTKALVSRELIEKGLERVKESSLEGQVLEIAAGIEMLEGIFSKKLETLQYLVYMNLYLLGGYVELKEPDEIVNLMKNAKIQAEEKLITSE